MSTSAAAAPVIQTDRRVNRVLERTFFAGMSALLLATVLYGFANTYFLAGMARAPLPNRLIHIHGAVFTLWIALLLAQTALITTRNVRVHMVLGLYGFALAGAMTVLGPLAAIDQLRRGHAPFGMDPRVFFVIPLTAIALFAVFVAWSWRVRRQPAAHKRLILLATITICDAAVGRWPVAVLQQHPPLQALILLGFVAIIAAYDLVSLRRIHKITMLGFLLLAMEQFSRVPLAQTHPWIAFADWVLRH